jgi:hypothetical protein
VPHASTAAIEADWRKFGMGVWRAMAGHRNSLLRIFYLAETKVRGVPLTL